MENEDKITVCMVVEGQDFRPGVFEYTPAYLKRMLNNFCVRNIGKKVWYYTYDEATGTWTRSKKYYWFRNHVCFCGKEEKGLKHVPELYEPSSVRL
jgi:hypothetical protein